MWVFSRDEGEGGIFQPGKIKNRRTKERKDVWPKEMDLPCFENWNNLHYFPTSQWKTKPNPWVWPDKPQNIKPTDLFIFFFSRIIWHGSFSGWSIQKQYKVFSLISTTLSTQRQTQDFSNPDKLLKKKSPKNWNDISFSVQTLHCHWCGSARRVQLLASSESSWVDLNGSDLIFKEQTRLNRADSSQSSYQSKAETHQVKGRPELPCYYSFHLFSNISQVLGLGWPPEVLSGD